MDKMMSATELMLCIIDRGYFDPLTLFWLCLISSQNVWDWFHGGLITDAQRDACNRMLYYATMYGTPSTVKKILLGCTVARKCMDATTPAHGMWTVKYTRINRMEVLCRYAPSKEFVERVATLAFLYMRPICGRDVAGIIARMVARMYLEDYEWLMCVYHYPSDGVASRFEMELRERIVRWLPNKRVAN